MDTVPARSFAPTKGVQTGARVLEVLSCFSTDHIEWGVSEIAAHLGLCKSGVYRFLQTLEEAGYVERTARHRYRLGVRALELGNIFHFQNRLLRAADQPMRVVAEKTGLLVHLAQLHDRDALELLRIAGGSESRGDKAATLRKPAHASAVGKVMLAMGGSSAVRRYIGPRKLLRRYTDFTIVTPAQLFRHLEQVRQKEYAVDHQESECGRFCLAVPIRGPDMNTFAALSVSSSSDTFRVGELSLFLNNLRYAARSIEESLSAERGIN